MPSLPPLCHPAGWWLRGCGRGFAELRVLLGLCLTSGSSARSTKPQAEKAQAFRSGVTPLPKPIGLEKREEEKWSRQWYN